jgi:EmrB/QacA subfamily drug resistance transporter
MIAQAARPSQPAVFSHEQIMRMMWGIALCIFLSALDQTIVVPTVPAMARDLHGFGQLSWIVSVYLLTSTAATPILGKLSDLYGRRAMLLGSILIFTVASVLCGIARTLPEMVLFRGLQGIGGAGLIAMAHATIADIASPRERGRYQVYLSGTWGAASVVGPIAGGYLTDHVSWRAIFWVNLPLGLIACLLTVRSLSILPRQPRRTAHIDYAGAALLTLAVTAGLLLLSWGGNEYGWTSGTILGLGGLAFISLIALSVVERARPDPLFPGRLFGNSVARSGFALSFCNAVCMMGATFLLPLYFQFMRGADASSSGIQLMPFLFAFVVLSYVGGKMARRVGRTKWLMVAASAITGAGLILMATADETTGALLSTVYVVIVGGGIGLIQPCITMTVQNAVDPFDLGVATSGTLLFRMIGGAFGATMVGSIVTGVFNADLRKLGLAPHVSLGTMHAARDLIGGMAGISPAAIEHALDNGFHWAFLGCAAIAGLGVLIGLTAKDPMLRTTTHLAPKTGETA